MVAQVPRVLRNFSERQYRTPTYRNKMHEVWGGLPDYCGQLRRFLGTRSVPAARGLGRNLSRSPSWPSQEGAVFGSHQERVACRVLQRDTTEVDRGWSSVKNGQQWQDTVQHPTRAEADNSCKPRRIFIIHVHRTLCDEQEETEDRKEEVSVGLKTGGKLRQGTRPRGYSCHRDAEGDAC